MSLQRRLWNGTAGPLAHGWNKPVPLTINYNHSQQHYTSDRKPASPADIHTVTLQGSALRIPVFTVFLWAGVFFTLKLLLEEIVLGPTPHLKAVRREVMQIRDGFSSMICKTLKQQNLISVSPAYHSVSNNHSFVLNITWSPTPPFPSKHSFDLIKSSQLSNLHTSNSEPPHKHTHTNTNAHHTIYADTHFNVVYKHGVSGKDKNIRNPGRFPCFSMNMNIVWPFLFPCTFICFPWTECSASQAAHSAHSVHSTHASRICKRNNQLHNTENYIIKGIRSASECKCNITGPLTLFCLSWAIWSLTSFNDGVEQVLPLMNTFLLVKQEHVYIVYCLQVWRLLAQTGLGLSYRCCQKNVFSCCF